MTQTVAPTAASTPDASSTAADSEASGDVPSWAWWLLAALVLALVVSIPLLVRKRRHRGWRTDLAGAEQEVGWFSRVLLPSLRQSGSLDQVAGGWAASGDRVVALESRLTALAASAPNDAAAGQVTHVRDVVRGAREQIQQLVVSGTPQAIPRVLGMVATELEGALTRPQAPPRPA